MTAVHLVDGTLELFRCHHGAPRAQDEEGREIGAARALMWTLSKLLRKEGATHVAVAFDRMAPDGMDGQAALALEVVRALGLALWPSVRNQADDLLASGAAAYSERVDQVVICTTDRDLYQSIRGSRVVLRDRIRGRTIDEEALLARWGVRPSQIPDRSALVGDPSDGLPGVPGWGDRSAAAILSAYDRLEAIPFDPSAWSVRIRGATRLSEALRARWDEALLVRDLSRLRTDLPVPPDPESLRWRGPQPELEALATRLGAPELPGKLSG